MQFFTALRKCMPHFSGQACSSSLLQENACLISLARHAVLLFFRKTHASFLRTGMQFFSSSGKRMPHFSGQACSSSLLQENACLISQGRHAVLLFFEKMHVQRPCLGMLIYLD